MASQAIFQGILVLHLTGLVLLAGTTIVDFVIIKQFWKQYEHDRPKAVAILTAMAKFPLLQRAGIALLILSGVGMMAMTHGVFGEQIWFRIKFALLIALILNVLLVGRRQFSNLRKISGADESGIIPGTGKIKSNLRWFHLLQFVFFLLIVVLSVFKFN